MAKSTTSRKTTTTTRRRSSAVARAPEEGAPVAKPAPDEKSAMRAAAVRKKELVDRVVARSGLKKRDVKPAVEAVLAELGEALSRGEALNLQPFGKVIVNRKKELANGEVLITRIRRAASAVQPQEAAANETPRDPLAEPAE